MQEEKDLELQNTVEEPKKPETTNTEQSLEKTSVLLTSKKEETKDATENSEASIYQEIEESNAEDAEDTTNVKRHEIPVLDYHSMSMENLVGELQRLVRNEKVQAIKKHVEGIKQEFDLKFQEFLEGKKEDFIAGGGNEIDFRYDSVTKRQFQEVYKDYREKKNTYHKSLEKNLKENLSHRLTLIENVKGLVNVEEDINTTYKNFKDIQEQWRNAGPIPRANYNDVWRTYQHHIEIFYDFLNINRELRDLDFKHNLVEKEKIVAKAEELSKEPNLNKAFRELQTLHKIWKEDIGPVGKEHRESIWERFSAATKVLHLRRQEYFDEQEKVYELNLEKKNEIISDITLLSANVSKNHKELQQQIKTIESLREAFFKAGKVPQKENEKTWAAFKEAVRSFNRTKNNYYKNLKKEQQLNLDKKRALLALAHDLKDSETSEATTAQMKRIQTDWKKIGHVPRKYSDKIWKEFKTACNHYFDRLHALKNKSNQEEEANYELKIAFIEKLKDFTLAGEKDTDITAIKSFIAEWKKIGRVPFQKKHINQKFNTLLDALFNQLDVSKQESELLKYGTKIQQLANAKDQERAIYNERSFIRKKIGESKDEIRQLENNLLFFSNASENNPMVQEVVQKVEKQKQALATWTQKLKKLNVLENQIQKQETAENSSEEE